MLQFLFGMVIGGAFGIYVMCLLQINRSEAAEDFSAETEFEKSTAAGVDNTAKKA